MNTITINSTSVGLDFEPFIIAELSGNHNQSLDRALAIVEEAHKAGVHALKLQTYTADTLTIDLAEREFLIDDPNSLWYGKSLYELYQQAHTPWDWHEPIINLCRNLGLICFSTPFDETAVDFLESFNMPAYKVASFENNHLPLIKKIAKTQKTILLSTGTATICDLSNAVNCARDAGCKDIILLKCTSSYPATPESSNLLTIPHMQDLFDCQVGLSDHTLGIGTALAGVALGATVIEKHFTLSRSDKGVDSAFSLEPFEMKCLVEESKRAWQSLGSTNYGPTEQEKQSLIFKRSIYFIKDVNAGEKLSSENIRIIRPGYGLSPKYYDLLIGRKVSTDTKRGTPLKWDNIL